MKKILLIAAAIVMPIIASAQAQIMTKDTKIEDFTDKTTKIVLSGNEFFDSAYKEEITARWNISAYEFCSVEEFERLKSDSDYYFLIPVQSRFRKEAEPGLQMLTLVKGGDGSGKGIEKMLEIVSIPICSSKYPSGREIVFLPAFIDIIQEQVIHALNGEMNAYSTLFNATQNMAQTKGMKIVFSEDDLFDGITPAQEEMYLCDEGIIVTDEESADNVMLNKTPNILVSYTVYPTEPLTGSYCYKMLIDAGTHKLYYFKKHKINVKRGEGFLAEDLMRIKSYRK